MNNASKHLLRAETRMNIEAGKMFVFRGQTIPGLISDTTLKDNTKYADDSFASMDAVIHILESYIGTDNPPKVDEEIRQGQIRYKIVRSEHKDWNPPVYHLFVKGDITR